MRRVASGRASHVNKKIFASSETYYLLWFGEIGDDKKTGADAGGGRAEESFHWA